MRGRVADALSGEVLECVTQTVGIHKHHASDEFDSVRRIMRT
jgi:hypothetical protein